MFVVYDKPEYIFQSVHDVNRMKAEEQQQGVTVRFVLLGSLS